MVGSPLKAKSTAFGILAKNVADIDQRAKALGQFKEGFRRLESVNEMDGLQCDYRHSHGYFLIRVHT